MLPDRSGAARLVMSQRVTTNKPRPFKRSGLHKLACPACATYAYFTVATLEDAGLPRCWREGCGEPLEPATLGLALELGMEDHELVIDYRRRTTNKEHSQARSVGGQQKQLARSETLASMDLRAYEEIRAEHSTDARARRVAALNRGYRPAEASPRETLTRESDPIPF